MRSREPKAMEEIHLIRVGMHSETAGMSMHEKLMHIRKRAEAFKTKYNLKTRLAGKHRELTRAKA